MPPSICLRPRRSGVDSPDVELCASTGQKAVMSLNVWRAVVLRLHTLMRSATVGHSCVSRGVRDATQQQQCENSGISNDLSMAVHISYNRSEVWLTLIMTSDERRGHRVKTLKFERKYEMPHLLNCSRKAMLEAAMLTVRREQAAAIARKQHRRRRLSADDADGTLVKRGRSVVTETDDEGYADDDDDDKTPTAE